MFLMRLSCSISFLLVSACSIIPGMQAKVDDFKEADYRAYEHDGKNVVRPLQFTELTPQAANVERQLYSAFPTELLDVVPPAYTIGVNDSLQLIVWNHPEISSPLGQGVQVGNSTVNNSRIVNESGDIFIPYAGEVNVSGLTIKQARQKIASALRRYIQDPQVDVVVTEHASQLVSVTGQVKAPASVAIKTKPIHLLDAINSVGGFTEFAKQRSVTFTRGDETFVLDLVLAAEVGIDLSKIYLLNGDQVFVPDNADEKVYVLGEVGRAQPVEFGLKGLSLMQALGEAGGVNQTFADASQVFVLRQAEEEAPFVANVFHLDAASPLALIVADNFKLRPRDIVYVGTLDVTRFNRVISQLLPSFGLYRSLEQLRTDLGGN